VSSPSEEVAVPALSVALTRAALVATALPVAEVCRVIAPDAGGAELFVHVPSPGAPRRSVRATGSGRCGRAIEDRRPTASNGCERDRALRGLVLSCVPIPSHARAANRMVTRLTTEGTVALP
jgi:hypothetical protein